MYVYVYMYIYIYDEHTHNNNYLIFIMAKVLLGACHRTFYICPYYALCIYIYIYIYVCVYIHIYIYIYIPQGSILPKCLEEPS